MLKTGLIFQDHMVIQRDKMVAVWGEAVPGSSVQVTMQGKNVETQADGEGKWKVLCGPFTASYSEKMTISSCGETINYVDVQVGEIWIAGGQSNMEFQMRYDSDLNSEKEICTDDALRLFEYPKVSYNGQIDEADYLKKYGFWRKAEPEQLQRFSAVGYYFAKDLRKKYGIPIGIVVCAWGGTPACAWMPESAVKEGGGQVYLDEYMAAVKNLDIDQYDRDFRNNPRNWKTDLFADPIGDMMMFGCSREEFKERIKEMGLDLSQISASSFIPQMGPKSEMRPGGLYHSMLEEIAPFSVRGIIWYQGESDGDTHPEHYRTLFPALIHSWRKLWEEDLPFLFVQIAPIEYWMVNVEESYAQIRAAQQLTVDTVPGTGMAVITDTGLRFDIHPKKKQPVGHRLALLAENKIYGDKNILCEAPTLISMSLKNQELILTFENAGEGLHLSATVPDGQYVGADVPGALQIFQNGKELDPAGLKARTHGCQMIVSGSEIKENIPTEVKMAYTGRYLVNLYNSADIPARPASMICK